MIFSDLDIKRFWSKVERGGLSACWNWTAATRPAGKYGVMKFGDSNQSSHRISFLLANGYLPEVVRHACDNVKCCNPHHLLPGEEADNRQDMYDRKRHAFGERNAKTKMTPDMVRDIRRRRDSGETYYAIAKHLGLDKNTIRECCIGKTWRHVS